MSHYEPAGYTQSTSTAVGVTKILEVTMTSAANAGAVTISTVTSQPCLIKSIVVNANAAQTANLTSCAVTGGTSGAVTFIDSSIAIQANLDATNKQVAWTGAVRLEATKTIVMTYIGSAATATNMTITIEYEACIAGGYLV